MIKEVLISIIILVLILSLDLITQKYTKESMDQIAVELTELKDRIRNDKKDLEEKIYNIYNNWEERSEKLSYFIEHDELEKVETNLTNVKSLIEEMEFNLAITSIDEAKFIVEHIKEKNAFNLENIF